MRDAIINDETGLIVDGERPDQVASAIIRLLTDPSLAFQLGDAGRRRVLNELTPQLAARRVREFSQRCVHARG